MKQTTARDPGSMSAYNRPEVYKSKTNPSQKGMGKKWGKMKEEVPSNYMK